MAKDTRSYQEKLKDPRWQQMRLKILERDSWTCCYCFNRTETLHVHHTRYIWGKDPWEYEPRTLITLCASCHDNETASRKPDQELLLDVLSKVPTGEINEFAVGLIRATCGDDDLGRPLLRLILACLTEMLHQDDSIKILLHELSPAFVEHDDAIGIFARAYLESCADQKTETAPLADSVP